MTLYVLDTLTTGKAAAQAAHAVWIHALQPLARRRETVDAWFHDGLPLQVRLVGAAELTDLASRPGAQCVVDAGLTEIDPGSMTAVALPR